MGGANQAVSGGIGGFLAFFLLACALWLLMRNMNKRLRNIKSVSYTHLDVYKRQLLGARLG